MYIREPSAFTTHAKYEIKLCIDGFFPFILLLHSLPLFVCRIVNGSFVCVSPQEFLSDREHGQARLSTVRASGELLILVVSKDRVEGIKAKVTNAREDWKSLMNNLQMREDALKVGLLLVLSEDASLLDFNIEIFTVMDFVYVEEMGCI